MKVVVCQNCGAKYQLDDDEDLESFECSICTGNLEEVEQYTTTSEPKKQNKTNFKNVDDSKLVYCEDCGLKFRLNKNDNINEFECVSCGGKLKAISKENETAPVTEEKRNIEQTNLQKTATTPGKVQDINKLKEDLVKSEKILQSTPKIQETEKVEEVPIKNTQAQKNNSEYHSEYAENILKKSVRVGPKGKISDELTNYLTNVEDQNKKKEIENLKQPSENQFKKGNRKRTKSSRDIANDRYELALYKYHDELKKQMKREYLAGITEAAYGEGFFEKSLNVLSDKFKNYKKELLYKPKLIHTDMRTPHGYQTNKQELIPHPNEENLSFHMVYIIVGSIVAIIGLADILLSKRYLSVLFIFLGVIIVLIGFYKRYAYADTEARGRIIRARLLTLPESYYVLYYVRPPESNRGINHVVIGPSGIFTIVTQKYNSKEDKDKIKQDKENIALMGNSGSLEEYLANKHSLKVVSNFRDTQTHFKVNDEKIKFDSNNKIKQETLILNEKLSQFLDENGLRGIHIEPLIGFVNNEVAVINVVLTNEDLFLEELLYKIQHSERKIDDLTIHKCAVLLSQYSAECSS
jgi:Zn ribbon nucleic-acid-binding protein